MNEQNTRLFFEQEEDTALITLTDEDGKERDGELVAVLEVEELNKEYAAVLPIAEEGEEEANEVLLFEYTEDENGDPVFSDVSDEEEYDIVAEAFNQFFSGEAEVVDEESPLGDEGDLFPGKPVSEDDK